MSVGCLHVPIIPPGMLERWVKNRNRLLGSLMGNAAKKTLRDGDLSNKPLCHSADSGCCFFRAPLPVHGPTARSPSPMGRSVVSWPLGVTGGELQGPERDSLLQSVLTLHSIHSTTSCPSIHVLCIRGPQYQQCVHRGADAQAGNPLCPGFISRLGDGDARNRNGLFNGTCTKLMTGSSGCGLAGREGLNTVGTTVQTGLNGR
jgi:hypothetical protein